MSNHDAGDYRWVLAFVFSTCALLPVAASAQPASQGEPVAFRTEFDRGSAIVTGLRVSALAGTPLEPQALTLEVGLGLRAVAGVSERGHWKLETWLLAGSIEPSVEAYRAGQGLLDVMLVRGRYARFSTDPGILLPSNPPRRLWFPFLPGIEAWALGLSTDEQDPQRWGELSLIGGSLLLDFLRSPEPGTWGYLGVGFRFDLRVDSRSLDSGELMPMFAPFTTPEVALHHEFGLAAVDAGLQWRRRWSEREGWESEWQAHLELSRIFLAINDQPIDTFARVGLDYLVGSERAWHEAVIASVGIRALWQLRR